MAADDARARLAARVDTIEECYEYMLAYAAQGREDEAEGAGEPGIRQYLTRVHDALGELGALAAASVGDDGSGQEAGYRAFLDVLNEDAEKAKAMVALVLAQPSIGSQIVDNLNASIHLRALLTDLFLIEEALK